MKSKRILRVVGVWTVWTVSIVGGVYGLAYLITLGMVALEVREARASGIPVELGQLAIQQVSSQENGAVAYEKAFDLLARVDLVQGRLPSSAIAVNDLVLPAGLDSEMDMLDHYQAALKAAEIAASKPACVFPVDWSKGILLRFPELSHLKLFARLEAGEAEIYVAKGQVPEALRHLRFAEKICSDMNSAPNFASETMFVAAQSLVFHSIISMLSTEHTTPALLKGVRSILDGLPAPPPIRFYAEGELVLNRMIIHRMPDMNHEELDELLAGSKEGLEREQLERILQMRSFNPLYDQNFVAYYRSFIDSLPKDDTRWSDLRKVAEEADIRSSDNSLPATGTLLFSKSLVGTCADYIKHLARTRMLACAVRLEEMQRFGEKLPEKLPDYGILSIDPFSGQPFGYDHFGDRFEVYSVGPNGSGAQIKGLNDLMVAIPTQGQTPPGKRLQAPGVQALIDKGAFLARLRSTAMRGPEHG